MTTTSLRAVLAALCLGLLAGCTTTSLETKAQLPPPLQSRGMAAYKKTWDLFFAYHQPGQAFDVEELQMCVGDTVAFAVAIMRCGSATVSGPPVPGGFQFRLTIGLCKVDGAWCIQHEHHSVPATD